MTACQCRIACTHILGGSGTRLLLRMRFSMAPCLALCFGSFPFCFCSWRWFICLLFPRCIICCSVPATQQSNRSTRAEKGGGGDKGQRGKSCFGSNSTPSFTLHKHLTPHTHTHTHTLSLSLSHTRTHTRTHVEQGSCIVFAMKKKKQWATQEGLN